MKILPNYRFFANVKTTLFKSDLNVLLIYWSGELEIFHVSHPISDAFSALIVDNTE